MSENILEIEKSKPPESSSATESAKMIDNICKALMDTADIYRAEADDEWKYGFASGLYSAARLVEKFKDES